MKSGLPEWFLDIQQALNSEVKTNSPKNTPTIA
jgi:hypothetical protein